MDNNIKIKYDDLGDIPKLVKDELQEVYGINTTDEGIHNICDGIIYYFYNSDKMTLLPEIDRQFFEKFTHILANRLDNKKDSSSSGSENGNEKTYRLAGFSNIILLSIIAIVIALIVIFVIFK